MKKVTKAPDFNEWLSEKMKDESFKKEFDALAVKQMWDGKFVQREGWNGKGMYLGFAAKRIFLLQIGRLLN